MEITPIPQIHYPTNHAQGKSTTNFKNDIIKHLDKHIKELFNKHLSQLKMEYEEFSKARNNYNNKKII